LRGLLKLVGFDNRKHTIAQKLLTALLQSAPTVEYCIFHHQIVL